MPYLFLQTKVLKCFLLFWSLAINSVASAYQMACAIRHQSQTASEWRLLALSGIPFGEWLVRQTISSFFEEKCSDEPVKGTEQVCFPVLSGGTDKMKRVGDGSSTENDRQSGDCAESSDTSSRKRSFSRRGNEGDKIWKYDDSDTDDGDWNRRGGEQKRNRPSNPSINLAAQLVAAVRASNPNQVLFLLGEGANPNERSGKDHPMVVAVNKTANEGSRRSQVLTLLIKHGGSCFAVADSHGNVLSILFSRQWDGQNSVRKVALESIADDEYDINLLASNGKPLLHTLLSKVGCGDNLSAEAVELLLEHGMDADIRLHIGSGKTALMRALEKSNNREGVHACLPVARVLMQHNAQLMENCFNSPFCSLLQCHWDNCTLREEALLRLQQKYGDLNCLNVGKQSLIMYVATKNRTSVNAFIQLLALGVYPLFLRRERPHLDGVSGNVRVKRWIKSIHEEAKARRGLQFLCMQTVFRHIKSRKQLSGLPIRSGFCQIIFGFAMDDEWVLKD